MSLPRLIEDLEIDKVMALPLALQHYQLSREAIELEGLNVLKRHATLADGSRENRLIELLLSEDYAGSRDAPQLRHLAGVTAMRLALGAATADWHNDAARKMARQVPDGLWKRPGDNGQETWAIEYDAGSYWGSVIQEKGWAFHDRYDGQIWGCWNATRVKRLQEELERAGVPARVIKVHWWGHNQTD